MRFEMDGSSFNQIVVDSSALIHNYKYIQNITGASIPVMAMVKADAYGHGAKEAAIAFGKAGCTIFGVGELREGVILRKAGIKGQIYVIIGFAPHLVHYFFQYDLIPIIYTIEAAQTLSAAATGIQKEIDVHIKVDTGMGRLGFLAAELPAVMATVESLPGLRIAGVMSHFPEADDPDSLSTLKGIDGFSKACSLVKKTNPGLCHIANSGAVLNFPGAHKDMVRAGITLYGYNPAGRSTVTASDLKPAMSFTSKVLQVKDVPPGSGISYGHTYITKIPSKIAVLPVGYEDGYSRSLSNRGEVLIRGKKAPVRGRVCMNMCMVDVTEIEGVIAGDEAVFLGSQGDSVITADDIAEKMGSISYEVVCMFGHNNNRKYQVG